MTQAKYFGASCIRAIWRTNTEGPSFSMMSTNSGSLSW